MLHERTESRSPSPPDSGHQKLSNHFLHARHNKQTKKHVCVKKKTACGWTEEPWVISNQHLSARKGGGGGGEISKTKSDQRCTSAFCDDTWRPFWRPRCGHGCWPASFDKTLLYTLVSGVFHTRYSLSMGQCLTVWAPSDRCRSSLDYSYNSILGEHTESKTK